MSFVSLLFLLAALSLATYASAVGGVAYYGTLALRWRKRLHQEVRSPARDAALPPISVLKPLCGVDDELEANLESFAAVDYPDLQIVCCAEAADDPGLIVARQVAARHPEREFVIVTEPDATAPNPKVRNLEGAFAHARHDLLLLSDSDTRLAPDDLRLFLTRFEDERVGYIYQPLVGDGERTWGAAFENLRVTELGGTFCLGARMGFGHHAVTGKGVLVRRDALTSAGDFSDVRELHFDDYALALRIQQAGWQLRLAYSPARTIHSTWTLRSSLSRHLRLAAGRWRMAPIAPLAELLLNPTVVSLPLAFTPGAGPLAWGACVLTKILLELTALRILRGRWLDWRFMAWLPLKDFISLALVVGGLFCTRFTWRGKTYRMHWGSNMTELQEKGLEVLSPSAS